jgi:hypothetical protein
MHHVMKAADVRPTPDYVGRAHDYARRSLINHSVGSVHTGFGLCEIGAGGMQDVHVHAYEESFYVLEGRPTLVIDQRAYCLLPGDCVAKVESCRGTDFSRKNKTGGQSPIRIPLIALPQSSVSLTRDDEAPHIVIRKSRLQPAEFLNTSAKGLLQHYRPITDSQGWL